MSKKPYWSAEVVLDQLQTVFNGGEPFSSAQAAQAMGCSKDLANARLNALMKKALIQRPAAGWYCLPEEDERILLVFKFDDADPEHQEWVKGVIARRAARLSMNRWQRSHAPA